MDNWMGCCASSLARYVKRGFFFTAISHSVIKQFFNETLRQCVNESPPTKSLQKKQIKSEIHFSLQKPLAPSIAREFQERERSSFYIFSPIFKLGIVYYALAVDVSATTLCVIAPRVQCSTVYSKTSTATVAGLSLCITAPNRTVKNVHRFIVKRSRRDLNCWGLPRVYLDLSFFQRFPTRDSRINE